MRLNPDKAAEHLLEECRMVLPGLQALFGFQLIVVFNDRFVKVVSHAGQIGHLMATGLVAVAIALVMAPAALHRLTDPHSVSDDFIRVSTRLLLASMFPLAIALAMEFYLLARAVLGPGLLAVASATGLFVIYILLWFALPRIVRLHGLIRDDQEGETA